MSIVTENSSTTCQAMTSNELLEHLNRLAPWKCRVLALDGRRPLRTNELAAKSSLSPATIKALTRADSWLAFEMSTIVKFTAACGVDLLHQSEAQKKLRQMMRARSGPGHLSTPQRRYWNSIFTGEKVWRKQP